MAYLGIRNPGDWPETPRLYPIIEQHILERKGPMRRGEILGAILASLAAEVDTLRDAVCFWSLMFFEHRLRFSMLW